MSIFIIIATAATPPAIGKNNINTQRTRHVLFEPVAGHLLGYLCVGLVGASLLAAAVLPLATIIVSGSVWFFQRSASISQSAAFFTLFTGNNFRTAARLIRTWPVINCYVIRC